MHLATECQLLKEIVSKTVIVVIIMVQSLFHYGIISVVVFSFVGKNMPFLIDPYIQHTSNLSF